MSRGNEKALGRKVPTDWKHVEKFPLTAVGSAAAYGPAVWGINWYSNFDNPKQHDNGEYWIGEGDIGWVRGGHAIAQPYYGARDTQEFYQYYDQGNEGACVGFSLSRAMSWLNRYEYDGFWLYYEAQKIDEWDGEDYEGTSVRAGCEMLRTKGHRIAGIDTPDLGSGIGAYRWAKSVDEILSVVGGIQKKRGAITFRNSWGTSYPQKVWMPAETAQRLIDEDGEIAVLTDR